MVLQPQTLSILMNASDSQNRSDEPASPTDEALMLQATEGDTHAFSLLVTRFQTPLVNFFRHLGVYNDAEDLVQLTFVRLFRYRDRYKPTAKLRTFLYLLARQVRMDWLRKRKRKLELIERFKGHLSVQQPQQRHPSTEEKLGRAEEALEILSDGMRAVVVLSVYQGLTYREIGEILSIPEGTVKTRMYHAMRKLRTHLEEKAP
jgi:RNA polymerase sigma-70 factor (ECF subfamily)